jgi:hypothetical protein
VTSWLPWFSAHLPALNAKRECWPARPCRCGPPQRSQGTPRLHACTPWATHSLSTSMISWVVAPACSAPRICRRVPRRVHVRVGGIQRDTEKLNLFGGQHIKGVDADTSGHELVGPFGVTTRARLAWVSWRRSSRGRGRGPRPGLAPPWPPATARHWPWCRRTSSRWAILLRLLMRPRTRPWPIASRSRLARIGVGMLGASGGAGSTMRRPYPRAWSGQ